VTISFTHPLTGRRLRSDWMAVERERGISVSSAVMSFEHQGLAFSLLDTLATRISAHWDFSEDQCRRRCTDIIASIWSIFPVIDTGMHTPCS
jgi:peptide subunit release factor RF-3